MTWFGLAKSWLSASLCWTRGASGSRGCNQKRRGFGGELADMVKQNGLGIGEGT